MMRTLSLCIIATCFILAGANHFMNPQTYLSMMPSYLPFPEALNLISGAAEIAGGIGVLIKPLRSAAGWGLIALLIAIFPANLQMALHGFYKFCLAPRTARTRTARLFFTKVRIWTKCCRLYSNFLHLL